MRPVTVRISGLIWMTLASLLAAANPNISLDTAEHQRTLKMKKNIIAFNVKMSRFILKLLCAFRVRTLLADLHHVSVHWRKHRINATRLARRFNITNFYYWLQFFDLKQNIEYFRISYGAMNRTALR